MNATARTCFAILVLVGISALLSTTVHAGVVPPAGDLSGDWSLPTTCTLPTEEECVFEGGGTLIQDGDQIGGQATLMLVSGPEPPCPAEMMATVMGTLNGLLFVGTLDGGQLGMLSFSGDVSPDLQMIQGTSRVPDGEPFQGTICTWSAARQQAVFIPTLSEAALALLAVLLLGGGLLMLRRRSVGSPG